MASQHMIHNICIAGTHIRDDDQGDVFQHPVQNVDDRHFDKFVVCKQGR